MRVEHRMQIDCSGMTPEQCSHALLAKLGHSLSFNLKAAVPTDVVHGAVSILHALPPDLHTIIVEVYETTQAPTKDRLSTLARPAILPTAAEIRRKLSA